MNKWMPQSKSAKLALLFLIILVVWMFVLQPYALKLFGYEPGNIWQLFNFALVLIFLVLGLIFSIRAIFKNKEKTILLWVGFVILCLLALMVIVFMIIDIGFPNQ